MSLLLVIIALWGALLLLVLALCVASARASSGRAHVPFDEAPTPAHDADKPPHSAPTAGDPHPVGRLDPT